MTYMRHLAILIIIFFTSKASSQDSVLETGLYYVVDDDAKIKRQINKTKEFYFLDPNPIVSKENFIKVKLFKYKHVKRKEYGLRFRLDEIGIQNLAYATKKLIETFPSELALIINDTLVSVALVNNQINGGLAELNMLHYTKEELLDLKSNLID